MTFILIYVNYRYVNNAMIRSVTYDVCRLDIVWCRTKYKCLVGVANALVIVLTLLFRRQE